MEVTNKEIGIEIVDASSVKQLAKMSDLEKEMNPNYVDLGNAVSLYTPKLQNYGGVIRRFEGRDGSTTGLTTAERNTSDFYGLASSFDGVDSLIVGNNPIGSLIGKEVTFRFTQIASGTTKGVFGATDEDGSRFEFYTKGLGAVLFTKRNAAESTSFQTGNIFTIGETYDIKVIWRELGISPELYIDNVSYPTVPFATTLPVVPSQIYFGSIGADLEASPYYGIFIAHSFVIKNLADNNILLNFPFPHKGIGFDAGGNTIPLTVNGGVSEAIVKGGSTWLQDHGAVEEANPELIPNPTFEYSNNTIADDWSFEATTLGEASIVDGRQRITSNSDNYNVYLVRIYAAPRGVAQLGKTILVHVKGKASKVTKMYVWGNTQGSLSAKLIDIGEEFDRIVEIPIVNYTVADRLSVGFHISALVGDWLEFEEVSVHYVDKFIPNNQFNQTAYPIEVGQTLIPNVSNKVFNTTTFANVFSSPFFDKSNPLIWSDVVRNSIYYNVENKNLWNQKELNQEYVEANILPEYKSKIAITINEGVYNIGYDKPISVVDSIGDNVAALKLPSSSFNGVDSNVDLGRPDMINFIPQVDAFEIEGWFKIPVDEVGTLYSKGSNADFIEREFQIFIESNSMKCYFGGVRSIVDSFSNDGQSHHIKVIVPSSTIGAQIYIDGVLQSGYIGNIGSYVGPENAYFGARTDGASFLLTGSLWNWKFYSGNGESRQLVLDVPLPHLGYGIDAEGNGVELTPHNVGVKYNEFGSDYLLKNGAIKTDRNYCRMLKASNYGSLATYITWDEDNNSATMEGASGSGAHVLQNGTYKVSSGTTFVFSADRIQEARILFKFIDINGDDIITSVSNLSSYNTYYLAHFVAFIGNPITFVIPNGCVIMQFGLASKDTPTYLRNPNLEVGTEPTEFSIAAEDVVGRVGGAPIYPPYKLIPNNLNKRPIYPLEEGDTTINETSFLNTTPFKIDMAIGRNILQDTDLQVGMTAANSAWDGLPSGVFDDDSYNYFKQDYGTNTYQKMYLEKGGYTISTLFKNDTVNIGRARVFISSDVYPPFNVYMSDATSDWQFESGYFTIENAGVYSIYFMSADDTHDFYIRFARMNLEKSTVAAPWTAKEIPEYIFFNKSDATIWDDDVRNSNYFDSSNPYLWDMQELNQEYINAHCLVPNKFWVRKVNNVIEDIFLRDAPLDKPDFDKYYTNTL